MKVAIVHDDLIQWGGAERVLLGICEVFPEAPIYTAFFDKDNNILKEKFKDKKIITSFLQDLPLAKDLYKPSFFLHGLAFEQFDFSNYDLVVSHTTRFAKSIITKPGTKHICYCHTPPRFLWNFSGEKTPSLLNPLISFLKLYDAISSKRVDKFLAGSKNTQDRIKKVYGADSDVLYPFIEIPKSVESFNGDYFLVISRLNRYKRVDIAVELFSKTGWKLKVVGGGPEKANLQRSAKSNIEFFSGLDDEMVANLLAGCRALIVMAEEDFGLTPLEAQFFGKPVIAFGMGGSLETITNQTGILFESQTTQSLKEAIEKLQKRKFNFEECRAQAQKFSKEKFKLRLLELIN